MPTPDQITRALAAMANDLAWLAIGWHAVVVAALAALMLGWRPSRRGAAILAAAPLGSVALTSAAYGNLFNTISLALLAFALALLGDGLADSELEPGPAWAVLIGGAAIAFGLVYPHFVEGSWLRALIAAPVGVVPCPTLALVAGIAIAAGGFGSRLIPAVLALWVAFYAWFGVQRLGVAVDLGLGIPVLGLIGVLRANCSGRRSPSSRGSTGCSPRYTRARPSA